MDIAIRASESMGGTRQDMLMLKKQGRTSSEAHFFRGVRPRDCHPGERVFFLENGFFHGYAVFQEYGWRRAEAGSGRPDGWAIVVRLPYVPIDPLLRAPKAFCRGSWRWRYIERHPETLAILHRAGL